MMLTEKQKQARRDRALARRGRERIANGATARDPKTGERFEMVVLPTDGKMTRDRAPVVEENMKLLKIPDGQKREEELINKRSRYASMKTHMEIAAIAIASGATTSQAARKAGVNRRQIRKYMESADFRERIAELQETLSGRIRGRVIKEIERRTNPEVIQKMELLDVLRVGDRFGLGRGTGNVILNDNRQVNTNYEANFNALFHAEDAEFDSDSGEESADFPEFEPTSVALSGGDSQV